MVSSPATGHQLIYTLSLKGSGKAALEPRPSEMAVIKTVKGHMVLLVYQRPKDRINIVNTEEPQPGMLTDPS